MKASNVSVSDLGFGVGDVVNWGSLDEMEFVRFARIVSVTRRTAKAEVLATRNKPYCGMIGRVPYDVPTGETVTLRVRDGFPGLYVQGTHDVVHHWHGETVVYNYMD